jgi:hypothetical protein
MTVRQGWLMCAAGVALLTCDLLQAEESAGEPTDSTTTSDSTTSQPAARSTQLFWLFGRPAYATIPKIVRIPASSTATALTSATMANSTPASAKLTTRRQDTQQPALTPTTPTVRPQTNAPAAAAQLADNTFGAANVPASQLSQVRRGRASGSGSDFVSGAESRVRATTDAGNLLGKSSQARGVSIQQRTPIMTDTRIRGSGVGRMVASGG